MTLAVVANTDGVNDLFYARSRLAEELVSRLLSGDVDADGAEDYAPAELVRLMMTSNEITRSTDRICPDPWPELDGNWSSYTVDRHRCPGAGSTVQEITAASDWREELLCRLNTWDIDQACPPEPLETAVIALSPEPASIDISPRMGLGESTNAAYRDRDDVLVLVLEAADWRDDCSRRVAPFPTDACSDDNRACCEAYLPPVSRWSGALREILSGRPVVYASFGQHQGFDPLTEPASALDDVLVSGVPAECYSMRPHRRMVQLARDLYPDMQLVPLTCTGVDFPGIADVEALARQVFSRFCE